MRNKNFSSEGQRNSDMLVTLLRSRLHDNGKAKSNDAHGNVVYVDCDIYKKEMLEGFIELSVSNFNQVPYFTFFTLEDDTFVDCFAEVLVEGATLYALSSQALIERGREFQIVDKGITFDPPTVSEMLNTQYCTLLSHHWEKLKTIKNRITEFKK
jgi:hypothetical protein